MCRSRLLLLLLRQYCVSIGAESERALEVEVIGGQVLAAVARIAKVQVLALAVTLLLAVEEDGCGHDGDDDGGDHHASDDAATVMLL